MLKSLEIIRNIFFPEGGGGGGEIIAVGTPENVAKVAKSYTGKYLAPLLK